MLFVTFRVPAEIANPMTSLGLIGQTYVLFHPRVDGLLCFSSTETVVAIYRRLLAAGSAARGIDFRLVECTPGELGATEPHTSWIFQGLSLRGGRVGPLIPALHDAAPTLNQLADARGEA